jgi:hypothetical protein
MEMNNDPEIIKECDIYELEKRRGCKYREKWGKNPNWIRIFPRVVGSGFGNFYRTDFEFRNFGNRVKC